MKKIIFSLCALTCFTTLQASRPQTINVDSSGIVSTGALKVSNTGEQDFNLHVKKNNKSGQAGSLFKL